MKVLIVCLILAFAGISSATKCTEKFNSIEGCYPAINDAITYCTSSVAYNTTNYFHVYYECLLTYKVVESVPMCAQCYCE